LSARGISGAWKNKKSLHHGCLEAFEFQKQKTKATGGGKLHKGFQRGGGSVLGDATCGQFWERLRLWMGPEKEKVKSAGKSPSKKRDLILARSPDQSKKTTNED